ncbi:MAG: GHKL domain-containing protein, partial [Heliobacteriaceae bacterium]|nr:GHKL domain-containing protein [Heliobacteriaceae bacterium]
KVNHGESSPGSIDNLLYSIIGLIATTLVLETFFLWYTWNIRLFNDHLNVLKATPFVTTVVLLLLLSTLVLLVKFQEIQRVIVDRNELRQKLEGTKALVKQYRTNQHEFLNHLQVVYGFFQINHPEEALTYIEEYSIRIRQGLKITGISRPEIAAVIVNKMSSVVGESTRFNIIANDDLSKLALGTCDAVSLVGNLVQNALEAIEKVDEVHRYIEIEVTAEKGNTVIRVTNGGAAIPKERIPKLFEFGYTTKQDSSDSGVGLSLIKKITEKYNGCIEVFSKEGETTFRVTIPDKLTGACLKAGA